MKKLAEVIVGAANSEVCRAGQQVYKLLNRSKHYHSEADSFFPSWKPLFCSKGFSIDRTRSTHIIKDDLLYLKSTDCRCCPLLQNMSTAKPRLVFD